MAVVLAVSLTMQSNISGGIIIDGDPGYVSVTKVLQSDPRRKIFYKSRGAKRKSGSLDSDSAATGKHRGTTLHDCFARYLTTGECDIPEIYLDYWQQLYDFVSPLNIAPTWAEKPVKDCYSHFTSGDTSCIWSNKLKVLGKPDLIGRIEGVNSVVEIKTSRQPYSKAFDHRKFIGFADFYNYSRAAMQCAAYAECWEERTGETIDCGIVINVMPNDLQFFVVEKPEMKLRLNNFKKLAREYHKVHQ